MEDITSFFIDEGILGVIIAVLLIVIGGLLRTIRSLYVQNQDLQREAREILREVLPAALALDKAMDAVQRGRLL